jgi:glycosyltransferase involved in cell wall biosynthesis
MLMGLPVVGSRVGGIPSLVEDGVTGALVPAADPAALAAALQTIVGSAPVRQQLGAAGRARAEADCRPDKTASCYVDMYRAAVAQAFQASPVAAGVSRVQLGRVTR